MATLFYKLGASHNLHSLGSTVNRGQKYVAFSHVWTQGEDETNEPTIRLGLILVQIVRVIGIVYKMERDFFNLLSVLNGHHP